MYDYQLCDDNGVSTIENVPIILLPGSIFIPSKNQVGYPNRYLVVDWRTRYGDITELIPQVGQVLCERESDI